MFKNKFISFYYGKFTNESGELNLDLSILSKMEATNSKVESYLTLKCSSFYIKLSLLDISNILSQLKSGQEVINFSQGDILFTIDKPNGFLSFSKVSKTNPNSAMTMNFIFYDMLGMKSFIESLSNSINYIMTISPIMVLTKVFTTFETNLTNLTHKINSISTINSVEQNVMDSTIDIPSNTIQHSVEKDINNIIINNEESYKKEIKSFDRIYSDNITNTLGFSTIDKYYENFKTSFYDKSKEEVFLYFKNMFLYMPSEDYLNLGFEYINEYVKNIDINDTSNVKQPLLLGDLKLKFIPDNFAILLMTYIESQKNKYKDDVKLQLLYKIFFSQFFGYILLMPIDDIREKLKDVYTSKYEICTSLSFDDIMSEIKSIKNKLTDNLIAKLTNYSSSRDLLNYVLSTKNINKTTEDKKDNSENKKTLDILDLILINELKLSGEIKDKFKVVILDSKNNNKLIEQSLELIDGESFSKLTSESLVFMSEFKKDDRWLNDENFVKLKLKEIESNYSSLFSKYSIFTGGNK